MLNAYGVNIPWRSPTTLVKKIAKKTQIIHNPYSALRTLKALKKLGKKQKTRGTRKEVVKIAAFVA